MASLATADEIGAYIWGVQSRDWESRHTLNVGYHTKFTLKLAQLSYPPPRKKKNHKKAYNVLMKFMVLCWAIFLAILDCRMDTAVCSWSVPRVASSEQVKANTAFASRHASSSFPAVVIQSDKDQPTRDGVYSSPQSQVMAHHCRAVKAAGTRISWSHYIHSKRLGQKECMHVNVQFALFFVFGPGPNLWLVLPPQLVFKKSLTDMPKG